MLIKLLAFCAMLVCSMDGAPMYDSLEPDEHDGDIARYMRLGPNPYTRGEEKFILRALKANLALGKRYPWPDVADIHKRKREAGEFQHKRTSKTLRLHFRRMIDNNVVPEDLVREYNHIVVKRTNTKERKKRGRYGPSQESGQSSKESRQSSEESRESSKESRESSKESRESSKGSRESSKGSLESSKGSRESSKGSRESSKGSRQSSKGSRQSRTESREDTVEEHEAWPEYEMQQLLNELDAATDIDAKNTEMVNELLHESRELDLSQFQEMTEEQRKQREYEMQQLINEVDFDGK